MIQLLQTLVTRILLSGLIALGFSSAALAQNGNWFYRWETSFPDPRNNFSNLNLISGLNWGITTQVKKSPLHAGIQFTYLNLGHKDWYAPFGSGSETIANAEHCSQSNSFSGEFLLRYEKNDNKRIIPYAEGGIGLVGLRTDYTVYQDNPDKKNDPITLYHSVISRDHALSASGGAGILIKLLRLNSCCEADWADLYLEIDGGGRTNNGTFVRYEGEGKNKTESLNPFLMRIGINIKFSTKRNISDNQL